MSGFAQDARHALRGFSKTPGLTAVGVLTLAVGIGANTAIFSVADALLLRPLPYQQSNRLVVISTQKKGEAFTGGVLSWTRFEQISRESRSFSGIAAYTNEDFTITGRDEAEQLAAARVSWNFLPVLGVQPTHGRSFRAEEDRPGGPLVALLSDDLWRRRFAADRSAAGRQVTLDHKDYTIIGVLPAGFRFSLIGPKIDVMTTRVYDLNLATPQQIQGGAGFLNAVARLREGVRLEQAQAELDALAERYRAERPGFPDTDSATMVRAGALREALAANYRSAVLLLFGAVWLVLLIACANLASLLLARALGRRRETAVRAALGAGSRRLIRQFLTESVMLALTGGLAALVLSAWATRLIVRMAADLLPRAQEIRTDGRVLLFTLGISVLAGMLFGLAPALEVYRVDLIAVLRSESRGTTPGRHRTAILNALVFGQVTLATVLLVGAGLLVRNFVQLRGGSAGFDSRNLLTMSISLPPAQYGTKQQMIAFFDEVVRRVRSLPGVRSAAAASALPANPSRFSPALTEGQAAVPLAQRPLFNIQTFTPGYIETLRVPLERGRAIDGHDGAGDRRVALVNEATARRFWPADNPIGKRIWLGRQTDPVEVVGVLGDIHNVGLASDTQPEIYLPFAQLPWAFMNLIVRTEEDPHRFETAVESAVQATDRDQPVTQVRSMEEVLDAAATQPRFTTSLLSALAGMALLLAIVGIYGVIGYAVAERTGELGVRIALGAQRADILRLVIRQSAGLALGGVAAGLMIALVAMRVLVSQLYRVNPTDPPVFAGSAVLLIAAAALASYLPARRAMRVDPMRALRLE